MATEYAAWWMVLDNLDEETAVFAHIPPFDNTRTGITTTINRTDWEHLGRPATVKVTVKPEALP